MHPLNKNNIRLFPPLYKNIFIGCQEMLSFIYTDSSENLNIYAKELFKAADQYQLDHLKGMSIFLENLSTSEIYEIC